MRGKISVRVTAPRFELTSQRQKVFEVTNWTTGATGMYDLSTVPKRTAPLIESSPGEYSPVWRATEYDLGHSSVPRWHTSMRTARRQDVLVVVHCGTEPLSRVCARAPPVQHVLRDCYKRGLHAFQGGRRHHGRFVASEEENGGGGTGGSTQRRASPGDVTLEHALR